MLNSQLNANDVNKTNFLFSRMYCMTSWYLFVSIPDLCILTNFHENFYIHTKKVNPYESDDMIYYILN